MISINKMYNTHVRTTVAYWSCKFEVDFLQSDFRADDFQQEESQASGPVDRPVDSICKDHQFATNSVTPTVSMTNANTKEA